MAEKKQKGLPKQKNSWNQNEIFLSICIPAYNRPYELKRLLNSIDVSCTDEIEIVISEDMSPRREEIQQMVQAYQNKTDYKVCYYENETNYGYDKNIRQTAKRANGKWILFMGDDDVFVRNSLNQYIEFLKRNSKTGYVLRRYYSENKNGSIEDHRYYPADRMFRPGQDAIVELFRRSVFISGFTFQKQCFREYDMEKFDGTLLFQLYIVSCICLKYLSAYCDIPITKSIEGGVPFFGSSNAEKGLYESGKNTSSNAVNFLRQVRILAQEFDKTHQTAITDRVIKSYAKYSYGYLFEFRDSGKKVFKQYACEIKKLGMADSLYFKIYYYALLLFGTKRCQEGIRLMKKVLGHTPRL